MREFSTEKEALIRFRLNQIKIFVIVQFNTNTNKSVRDRLGSIKARRQYAIGGVTKVAMPTC
jgi:hypothetical protein